MADPLVNTEDDQAEEDIEMEGAQIDEQDGLEEDIKDPTELTENVRRIGFVEYLRSPIVELVIGSGSNTTVLYAHQDLLTKSPCLERRCAEFTPNKKRRLDLPEDDVEAIGSFLEYLYNGEYFPRLEGQALEKDPSIPVPDNTGEQLLKHARIYTLGERFEMPSLKTLAHSKIHRTTSTARGEIAYARYVYANTSSNDTTIRRPVAVFWAMRSHVLRHDAEAEFRAMCMEYPQFGFDVLSRVLDQKEKAAGAGVATGGDASVTVETPSVGRTRKRFRASVPAGAS